MLPKLLIIKFFSITFPYLSPIPSRSTNSPAQNTLGILAYCFWLPLQTQSEPEGLCNCDSFSLHHASPRNFYGEAMLIFQNPTKPSSFKEYFLPNHSVYNHSNPTITPSWACRNNCYVKHAMYWFFLPSQNVNFMQEKQPFFLLS